MTYLEGTNAKRMKEQQRRKKKTKRPSYKINFEDGKTLTMEPMPAYGIFISNLKSARSLGDLNAILGVSGLTKKSVEPLVNYLQLSPEQFATLIGVSTRTVTRWSDQAPIGLLASKKLVELDRITRKGAAVFGDTQLFKEWLEQPNTALGDVAPVSLIAQPFGLELIEDAIEALEYGNVM